MNDPMTRRQMISYFFSLGRLADKSLSQCLREFQMDGAAVDDPEGSRFVRISETLWTIIVDTIEEIEESKEADEKEPMMQPD